MSWRIRAGGAALALVLGLGWGVDVYAQGRQTATLTGTVADSTGAVLPGVTVTVTGDSLIGGPQTAVSDSQGIYRFPALPPGMYTVRAELQGFNSTKREGIRLPLGQTVTVDLGLALAGQTESVTVTGESPVVDVKASSSPTNIDNSQLQNLPTGRFQPDIINLTPGVSASVAFGGAQSSNALLMDGVDVSDPEGGSPWSFFNYNWVQEVQVVSLGANAEYGEFTGVAANSVIRSGTNKFSGLGEYWTIRPNWIGKNTGSLSPELQEEFTPRQIVTNWDSTLQVGGPIVRDKLWFFTGFQYYKRIDRPAGFTSGVTSERDPRFLTKVNWAASSSVRVEGFFEKDKYDVTGRGAGPTRPAETTVVEPSPEVNWNVRATWTINPSTLLEIKNGGYDGYFPLEPTPPNTRSGPAGHYDGLTGLYSVNTNYYGKFTRKPNVTSATLTKYVDKFAGKSHEFKFGFEYERAKITNEFGYPANKWYYDYGGEPYLAYLWDGYITNATTKRTTVYAQDSWTVSDHLTINPGVRFNVNRGSVPLKGTVFKTNPVSPRIGFAWDVAANHKTVVRGHYGRYHDAVLASNYEFMDLSQQHPYSLVEVLGPGEFSDPLFTIDYTANVYGIANDIKQSFVDQYLLGVERELFPDFSLTAQYIKRNFRNFLGFVDTGSIYQPVQRQDPGPDGVLGTGDDGAFLTAYDRVNAGNEFYQLTNPDGAYRDYNGVQLIGSKRFSHNWQARASYTWSRTKGTVNNSFGSNAAGGDLGTGGVFADPNSAINADARANFDYTNEFKADGTYRVPYWGGFNISLIYQYRTGLAWGRRARLRGLTQGNALVYIEPRGTRRLPPLKRVDFRLEKTWHLRGAERTIGFYADVFNLTNQGTYDSDSRGAVIDTSGSTFGQPNDWVEPRNLRAGIRFTF